jgi:hypothetical protein
MADLSINGDNKFFSIDGGKTALANFATGKATSLGADGDQASHWKHQINPVGIMDPFLAPSQRRQIAALDRRAMDVIGWDVSNLSQLNWQAMYNQALTKAQTARVANRDQDVQTMVEQSQVYEWGTSGRRWQKGFWQYILDQQIAPSATVSQNKPILTTATISRIESLWQESWASEWSNYDNLIEDKTVEGNLNHNNEFPTSNIGESQLAYIQDEQNDLLLNSKSDRDLLLLDDLFNQLENQWFGQN